MAVTTSPRVGITRWSAATDPFTRAQMDGDNAKLDDVIAIDAQGVLTSRPAAGIRGRYYFATDNGLLYRDTGSVWTTLNTPTSFATVGTSAVGDTAAEGSAATVARSDHRHAREAFGAVTSQTSFGAASTNGTATTLARADHTHGTPANPVPAYSGTVANDTSFGLTPAVGTANTIARGDHSHGTPANPFPGYGGSVTAEQGYGQATAIGAAGTVARSDHSHGTPAMPTAAQVGAVPEVATNRQYARHFLMGVGA